MLEVQEERAAAAGPAATHFNKKERGKKEREEAKDGGRGGGGGGGLGGIGNATPGPGSRNVRAKAPQLAHTGSPHQLITPPCSVVLGAPSMHSNRLKNSPSTNTQSPKPKTDAMVRSPPVMSPSQLDSKLPNQGKPGSAGSQSQASPCDPKTLGAKGSGGVAGSLSLKNGQGLTSGQGSKVKVKRERSTSVESYEQPETGAPAADDKDSSRVKRMCVAERRQPYSGADWCSGGESDEDDKGFFNCNSSDVKPQDSMSHNASNAGLSRSSTPSHNALGGAGATSDSAGGQKSGSKVVYVFTTEMANKAADAVLTGHTENIITFHMKNISNSKEKTHLLLNNQVGGPLRNDSKPPQQPSSHPQDQNHQSGSKPSLPGLSEAAPAQPPSQGGTPGGLPQDGPSSAGMDPKSLPGNSPGNPSAPGEQPPVSQADPGLNPPQGGDGGQVGGPGGPGLTPQQQQQQQLAQELLNMEANTEGLSQEQMEHRQRSLQTLRDIQRMLFPDDRDAPPPGPQQPHGGPHEGMSEGGQRRPEQGPLQAMMAQSQSLGPPGGGGGGPRPQGPPFGPPHGPRDMPPFPQDEMGPHMGPGGCVDTDQMTPEQAQVAWLKLQQEFYEEKKRKQEMQHRPLPPDMMMHPHGPRGMMRGPPPPYQMGPGEMWGGPGGGPPEHYQERMAMGPGPRGMPPHMQRMPGFPQGMMNPEMEGPPRPGMGWPDDMPPRMGDARGFPGGPGGMFGGPGGRGERFPNPQSVQEAMFHQGMAEKGIPPGMMMDMQRMMGHQRGGMEPGNGMGMFPRMPGDGPMSPSSRLAMGGRDMGPEFGMGPGPGPHMHPSKLREPPMNMSPDEMMRMRAGGGPPMENMGPQGRPMQGPHFAEQGQPGDFPLGPGRPFPGGPGGGMRGPHGEQAFGPEHRSTPAGGNGRLNHLPPASGPPQGQRGRKPADLNVQAGGGNSPSVNPLKSPPLRQVQSPMMGSPSGNLKSPQTPSQLAGMLSGPPGPNAPPAPANSAPMKSPHSMMGSAGASPVHMRSPSLPNPSPGWASSPKPPMQSPGVPPQQGKPPLSMTSPNMMGNMEQGGNGPPPPPSSGAPSGPMSLPPGSVPSGSPYTIPPEPTLSQNPLSIMMSRMSKFAMPSSTPLYHDAIKTVASSDDDSPPARSPNLPPMNNNGMLMNHHQGGPRTMGPGSSGPMPALSPLGMTPMGSQPLSHGMPPQMPSPNAPNMGPGMMPHGMMMPPNPQDPGMANPQMMAQGRMGYPPHRGQGYPLTQSPSQQGPFSPHNGPGPQGFPGHPMSFQGEGGPMGGGRMGNMPHGGGGDGGMCKPNTPGGPEFNSMQGGFSDADLHEVMRPGASGIPEFDLSRIIPSEKPSQTLSYFPRGGGGGDNQGGKPPHPSAFPMQGMMGDGPPRMGLPMQGMGGMPGGPGGGMGPQDMPMGNHPGHNNMRPPGFMGQGMMGPQHRMMAPGGPGGMMQGRQMPHPGPGGSPNMMMSLQGMGGPPQQTMMMGQMRPRSMDMDMGFSPGPGMF